MTRSEPAPPDSEPPGTGLAHAPSASVQVSTRFAVIALWSLVCSAVVCALTALSGAPTAAAVLAGLGVLGGAFFALERVIR